MRTILSLYIIPTTIETKDERSSDANTFRLGKMYLLTMFNVKISLFERSGIFIPLARWHMKCYLNLLSKYVR